MPGVGCRVIYEYCLPRKVYRAAPRRFYLAGSGRTLKRVRQLSSITFSSFRLAGARRNGKGAGFSRGIPLDIYTDSAIENPSISLSLR